MRFIELTNADPQVNVDPKVYVDPSTIGAVMQARILVEDDDTEDCWWVTCTRICLKSGKELYVVEPAAQVVEETTSDLPDPPAKPAS